MSLKIEFAYMSYYILYHQLMEFPEYPYKIKLQSAINIYYKM